MILPATYATVLILLIASLFCLGTWINTFKATGPKWRFELFSMDFSAGALLLVVIAAYTLGTLGSDLGFSDRMLVSGRTNEVLAIIAGAVFNLGNMLLLASVSLIGISAALPLSVGIAFIVNGCFQFRPHNVYYLIGGAVLVLVTILLELRAARLREAGVRVKKTVPPVASVPAGAAPAPSRTPSSVGRTGQSSTKKKPAKKRIPRRAVRGVTAGLIGGIALGFFIPILQNCIPGDIGLGPYAGMLLFGVGVFASTIVYNFYFLNIAIEGEALTFASYFQGNRNQHLLGFLGGAMCMGGLLAGMIAIQSSASVEMPNLLQLVLPLLSAPLAVFYGAAFWKEWNVPTKSRSALLLGFVLFLCSIGLFAYGFNIR